MVAFDHRQLAQLFESIDQKPQLRSTELPFECGWAVYLSYEVADFFQYGSLDLPLPESQPLAAAVYCHGAVVFDHLLSQTWICADSQQHLSLIEQKIAAARSIRPKTLPNLSCHEPLASQFCEQVEACRDYIIAGDIYQANLSRQWHLQADDEIDGLSVFAALKKHNPAPFAAFFRLVDWCLVSASPERLLQLRNGELSTRPIAGTRPRGGSAKQDQELLEQLLNTPKEQAEHIMLIDLERNDIGRVSQVGSVCVDELMVIESYPSVHHIVSNVVGRIDEQFGVVDCLAALFPGGTITGCPKFRCMEIIRELEQRPRGFYTGSLGYVNHDGAMDFNILIRSVMVRGRQLDLFAGAGIVFDSEPKAELLETRHKAAGLLRALGVN